MSRLWKVQMDFSQYSIENTWNTFFKHSDYECFNLEENFWRYGNGYIYGELIDNGPIGPHKHKVYGFRFRILERW